MFVLFEIRPWFKRSKREICPFFSLATLPVQLWDIPSCSQARRDVNLLHQVLWWDPPSRITSANSFSSEAVILRSLPKSFHFLRLSLFNGRSLFSGSCLGFYILSQGLLMSIKTWFAGKSSALHPGYFTLICKPIKFMLWVMKMRRESHHL